MAKRRTTLQPFFLMHVMLHIGYEDILPFVLVSRRGKTTSEMMHINPWSRPKGNAVRAVRAVRALFPRLETLQVDKATAALLDEGLLRDLPRIHITDGFVRENTLFAYKQTCSEMNNIDACRENITKFKLPLCFATNLRNQIENYPNLRTVEIVVPPRSVGFEFDDMPFIARRANLILTFAAFDGTLPQATADGIAALRAAHPNVHVKLLLPGVVAPFFVLLPGMQPDFWHAYWRAPAPNPPQDPCLIARLFVGNMHRLPRIDLARFPFLRDFGCLEGDPTANTPAPSVERLFVADDSPFAPSKWPNLRLFVSPGRCPRGANRRLRILNAPIETCRAFLNGDISLDALVEAGKWVRGAEE